MRAISLRMRNSRTGNPLLAGERRLAMAYSRLSIIPAPAYQARPVLAVKHGGGVLSGPYPIETLEIPMTRFLHLFWLLALLSLAACGPAEPEVTSEPTADSLPAPADVAGPPADATVLPSGLAYKVLQAGAGETHPTLADTVVVHYTGWTTDGAMFDSSVLRGEPAEFPLHKLIEGWQQGIPLMVVGEKARFWIPGALAYDNRNRPDAPKGMLVFDVELLGIKPAPENPAE